MRLKGVCISQFIRIKAIPLPSSLTLENLRNFRRLGDVHGVQSVCIPNGVINFLDRQ